MVTLEALEYKIPIKVKFERHGLTSYKSTTRNEEDKVSWSYV